MAVLEGLKQNQAREVVLQRIRTGDYRPGQRLPSERELALDLELSHLTLRRALKDLVDAGLIVRKPRVGTFVQETRSVELADRVAIVVPEYIGSPDRAHPFFPILMRGIMSGLDQRDCAVSLISYKYPQFWHDAGEAMLARGVKGAIIWTDSGIPEDQMVKLAESGIHAILLNAWGLWPHLRFSTVSIDFRIPMREAMQRLVDLGHRRILWLTYEETRYRDFEEKLMLEFARKYDLADPEKMIHRLPDDPPDFSSLPSLLADKRRPTAIVIQDEISAHEVFRTCQQLGLSVPGDVSLVALADSLPRSHMVPLSAPDTIGLWTGATGRASEHMRYMMSHDDDRLIEISLHATIQWKASTDKPRQTERSAS